MSTFAPDVFVQGSFRLGTVIKPQSEDEDYDVDCACVLTNLDKAKLSQAGLKELLGGEIKLYRKSKGITKEAQEGRRSWRLVYTAGAQFHMDIVPSIPNGKDQRRLLETHNLDARFADTAIAITGNEVPLYDEITADWPRSNTRGYAEWFKSLGWAMYSCAGANRCSTRCVQRASRPASKTFRHTVSGPPFSQRS